MPISRHVSYRILSLGLVLALGACSSADPVAAPAPVPVPSQPPDPIVPPSEPLDPAAACLSTEVRALDTVIRGEGFTAQVRTTNICDYAFQVPLADATAIYNGEGTGVEISFHLDITDPEVSPGQGYPVRWSSGQPNKSYVDTQKFIVLAPDDELVRNLVWDGLFDDGEIPESGNYVLFGSYYYTHNGISAKDFGVILGQKSFEVVSD